MWKLFKLTNLLWLLIATYIWITSTINQGPILIVVNVIFLICLSFLPVKFRFDRHTGVILLAILLISLWYLWIDGPVMGLTTLLMYMPVVYLIQLPFDYQKDLLRFTTKWYAILLIPSLLLYWATLVVSVPSIGKFVHPNYVPFYNHIFYIETTFDYGTFVRFNAFFLEPGHQALLSTFLLIANRYRFKQMPLLWVLVVAIMFSFSLAGYLLAIIGFVLLRVNTVIKAVVVGVIGAVVVGGIISWTGDDSAVNELILKRLEKDDSKGIKGNNRFNYNTDFTYSQAVKKGRIITGVKDRTNMELIDGAGFKIFIINYGLIGVLLALFVYLALIPSRPDYRYTISFLIVLILCFFQRSYPGWYSWLFPYTIGIYIAKWEKEEKKYELLLPENTES